jgi:phage gp16-like protein
LTNSSHEFPQIGKKREPGKGSRSKLKHLIPQGLLRRVFWSRMIRQRVHAEPDSTRKRHYVKRQMGFWSKNAFEANAFEAKGGISF